MRRLSRLKKASSSHSPVMHNEVKRHILDEDGNRWRVMQSKDSFLLAKRLLADMPIVPTNERLYDLTHDIMFGYFEDISSIEDAEENWDLWIKRASDLLKSRGILF